jgi:hypothetical protein
MAERYEAVNSLVDVVGNKYLQSVHTKTPQDLSDTSQPVILSEKMLEINIERV